LNSLLSEYEDEGKWLKGLRLLYVEDEEGIREQLEQFLQRRVQRIVTATNGQEGLETFKQFKPDIVVTDLLMPA